MDVCRNVLGRLLAIFMIVGLVALMAPAAAFAPPLLWDESFITTNLEEQTQPAIDAGRVVWKDNRNFADDGMEFQTDIFTYDLNTSAESKVPISGPSLNIHPSTYGDYIVWEGALLAELDRPDKPDNMDIYSRDVPGATQRRLTSAQAPQEYPTVSGTKVVFQDKRTGNYEIYSRDLVSLTEKRITNNAKNQIRPRNYGNRVVWQDARNGQWDIYLYDLSKNKLSRLTDEAAAQITPDISGMRVVWQDNRFDADGDIYLKDLSTGVEKRLTTDPSAQKNPRIAGAFVVWEDYRDGPSPHIYIYDLLSGVESRLSVTNSNQTSPDIHANNVVWQDDRAGNPDILRARLHPPFLTVLAPATVGYKAKPVVYANLASYGGMVPLAGVPVRIEKSSDALTWKAVGTLTTNPSGHVEIASPELSSRTYFRAVCVGNAGRLSVETAPVKVVPTAYLNLPSASRVGTRKYGITGVLQPRHAAGTKPVRIYMEFKQGDTWTTQGFFSATAENFYSYSRYRTTRTFSKNGSWRIRAYHEDSGHAPTWSPWRYISAH
jgi:TolB protein